MAKAEANGENISIAVLCLRSTPVDSKLPGPVELICDRKLRNQFTGVISNTSDRKDQVCLRLQERLTQQKACHDRSTHGLKPLHPGHLDQDPNTG